MNISDAAKFKALSIKSKPELLRAIDNYIHYLGIESSWRNIESVQKNAIASLVDDFKTALENTDLCFLDNTFDRYEVTITETSIFLDIATYTKIEFGEGNFIESAISEVTPKILEVYAPYIPIKEYAAQHSLNPSTILRWITDGKLKNVEKRSSRWFISSVHGRPERDFRDGTFLCRQNDNDLSNIIPAPPGTMYYSVKRNSISCSNNEIEITAYDKNECILAKDTIALSKYREIEHALLVASDVIFFDTYIDLITEKAPIQIDVGSIETVTLEEIGFAIHHMDIDSNSKMILNAIVHSLESAELLMTVLDELGLKSALKEALKNTNI